MTDTARLSPRLNQLKGAKIALLDCGKRGGKEIVEAIGRQLKRDHGARTKLYAKTSAHSMASRKLIEALASDHDAVVYGVVN